MAKKIKGEIIDSILTFPTVNPTIDVKSTDFFLVKKNDNPLSNEKEKVFSLELVEKKIEKCVKDAIKSFCNQTGDDFNDIENTYYPHVYAIAKKRLIIH